MIKVPVSTEFAYNSCSDFDFYWVVYKNNYFLECNNNNVNISNTKLIPDDKKGDVSDEGLKVFKNVNGYDYL